LYTDLLAGFKGRGKARKGNDKGSEGRGGREGRGRRERGLREGIGKEKEGGREGGESLDRERGREGMTILPILQCWQLCYIVNIKIFKIVCTHFFLSLSFFADIETNEKYGAYPT